jgi:alpha-1,2-mannosyltransferase
MAASLAHRPLLIALRRLTEAVALGALPIALVAFVLKLGAGGPAPFYDFTGDLWQAGRAILHGHDPYRDAFLTRLAATARAGGSPRLTFAVPVYPAPALLAAVPLALAPAPAAGLAFALASIAAMLAGLRLLGVRDWRCHGAAFLSWPLLHTLRLGQVNCLLLLAVAAAWRWRDRPAPAAVAVALAVCTKLLLWPLGVWLAITGRRRASLLAALAAVGLCLAAWAAIGFDGLLRYPRMLANLSAVEGGAGVSLRSAGAALGLPAGPSDAVAWLTTAGLLAGGWWIERSDRVAGERRAFGLAVMAALSASSLVWPHYLTLVFVPIALLSPTLSGLWLVPLLAYLAPVEQTGGEISRIAPYLLIEVIVATALLAPSLRRASPALRARATGADPGPERGRRPADRLAHGLRSTRCAHILRHIGRLLGHSVP